MNSRVVRLAEGVVLELRWIPPGEFVMGSPETEQGHEAGESPEHLVRFTHGFWMGTYPVTQQQWEAVTNGLIIGWSGNSGDTLLTNSLIIGWSR